MLKTKILSAIFLFIFFSVITSVMVAGILFRERKREDAAAADIETSSVAGVTQSILTEEEVAKHSQPSDCWIIIGGNVYNVTGFLNDHPGGAGEILPFCGQDATNAFASKNKNPASKHSQLAVNMLADYLIGKLGDVLSFNNLPADVTEPVKKTSIPSNLLNPTLTPVKVNSGITLTTEEVAKHSQPSDCWMIISGKVYNFTSYISQHPGGSVIIPYCGKDGTTGFQTQGGKGSHSSFASSLFAGYYLGDLGTTATTIPQGSGTSGNPQATTNPQLTTPQTNTQVLPSAILSYYPDAVYISGKYEDEGGWEGKISVSGQCRAIKINSGGYISEDKNC